MSAHERISKILQDQGIQPSAQRVAIAEHVLQTERHPTADEVLAQVRRSFPMVSRATTYNTLRLFVARGLLRTCRLEGGVTVYDANVEPHHHFIDDTTGEILDVPWGALAVEGMDRLEGYAVDSWMVVMRGRRSGGPGT